MKIIVDKITEIQMETVCYHGPLSVQYS